MTVSDMNKYYSALDLSRDPNFQRVKELVSCEMQDILKENPDISPVELKSFIHSFIAEHFEPVIFTETPFFYEMGLRNADSWGGSRLVDDLFVLKQTDKVFSDRNVSSAFENFDALRAEIGGSWRTHLGLYRTPTPGFDTDHNSIGYTLLFKVGISGLLEEVIKSKESFSPETPEHSFCVSCERSLRAVIKIAHKFARSAEMALEECKDPAQRKYMEMIASSARHIPEYPPRNFYEGLAFIWFMREVSASLESVGISTLGQVDLLLGDLYEKDIAKGAITKDEARELIRLWIKPTDIKFNNKESEWAETSTCITLGGCDAEKNPVFNDVTRLIIDVHCEMNLVAPKLNLRYSKNSPDEYLRLVSRRIIEGHNNFALSCDDIVIPSLEKCGFAPEDARRYVNGGCQETIVEGAGHTAGAYLYVLLPAIMDMSLNSSELSRSVKSENVRATLPTVITDAPDFESFYSAFLDNTKRVIRNACENQVVIGKERKNINPCPLFSSTHKGCVESGRDYTEGGARYNFSTLCLCGIATLTDSLYAIKRMVYDSKRLSLGEFSEILLNNWQGAEDLRRECIKLPKYGHGIEEVDTIANRFIGDLNEFVQTIENERGGKNILSMFTYYLYKTFARYIRATPDGRCDGDYLSQGVSASRIQKSEGVAEIFETVKRVDYARMSGIHVLDLMFAPNIDEERLASIIKLGSEYGCANLQINCLSREQLIEAKRDPEKHRNLIVRVAGLSVYFVNLEESIQEEIISRTFCK